MIKKILKHKKYLLFICIILIISIVCSIIYYNLLDSSLKEDVLLTISNYNNYRYNSILKDLIILSLLLITSFFFLGIPLSIFYLFYEFFSISFVFIIFFVAFGFKGILYILLYILINKFLFIIILLFFIKKIINITRYIIGFIMYKEDNIKNKVITNFINSLYLIVFVFVLNIILYFITPYIFSNLVILLS